VEMATAMVSTMKTTAVKAATMKTAAMAARRGSRAARQSGASQHQ